MTTTRDPTNPVWPLLHILRSDLRPADLADACAAELAELQEQLDHWSGVVAARRLDMARPPLPPRSTAPAPDPANWPDALERTKRWLELSA